MRLPSAASGADTAADAREPGGDDDSDHRRDGVLPAPGASEVPDLKQGFPERAQAFGRDVRPAAHRPRPQQIGKRADGTRAAAGIAAQGRDVKLLPDTVGLLVPAVGMGVSLRRSRPRPASRNVHGSGEPRWIHERLRDERFVTTGVPPVVAQPPGHRGEGTGGEVWETARCARDREASVVADQVQARVPEKPVPADPAVAGETLEGTGLPAGKADPPSPPLEHVAQIPN